MRDTLQDDYTYDIESLSGEPSKFKARLVSENSTTSNMRFLLGPRGTELRFRLRSFSCFFFLVAVVLRVRYANAEPTFLKAEPRSQCHPRVKAPTDEQE